MHKSTMSKAEKHLSLSRLVLESAVGKEWGTSEYSNRNTD